MIRTGHRPEGAHDSTEEKSTDGRGKAPKRGAAVKISQAWSAENRPESADTDLVQAVALRAWDLDVHPAEIWDEVTEAAGGPS